MAFSTGTTSPWADKATIGPPAPTTPHGHTGRYDRPRLACSQRAAPRPRSAQHYTTTHPWRGRSNYVIRKQRGPCQTGERHPGFVSLLQTRCGRPRILVWGTIRKADLKRVGPTGPQAHANAGLATKLARALAHGNTSPSVNANVGHVRRNPQSLWVARGDHPPVGP